MDLIHLLARVGADTSDFDSAMNRISHSATGLAGGLAIGLAGAVAGGVAASVKVAADFDQSLRNLASSTGATTEQVAAIRQEALGIGKDTSLSASEAVAAMTELAKAGMSTETVVGGAARAVVQLAEATGASVTDMAVLTSNAMNTFQKDGLSAVQATNLIAKAANASAIGTGDLAQSLAAVGPVASLAGLTMEDFAIATGLMGNHALKGSDAGTSLKTMLTSLAAPTDGARKLMDQLGISLFDAAGHTKPFREVIGELQRGLAGATAEQQAFTLKALFGQDAIRVGTILLGEGVEGWDKFNEAMGAAPSIAEQSAIRIAGLKGTVDQFWGSLETAGIGIGTKFLPGLQSLASMGLGSLNNLMAADWSGASASFDKMGEALGRFGGPLSIVVDSAKRAFGLDAPDAIPNLVTRAMDSVTGTLNGIEPAFASVARIIDLAISGDISGAFTRLSGLGEANTDSFVKGLVGMTAAGATALVEGIGEYGPKAVAAMVVVNTSLEEWGRTTLYQSIRNAATDAITRGFQEGVRSSLSGGPGDFWANVTNTITNPAKLQQFQNDLMSFILPGIGPVFTGAAESAAKAFINALIAYFKANFRWTDLFNPMAIPDLAKRGFDQAVTDEKNRQTGGPVATNPVNPSVTDYPGEYGGERAEGGPMNPFTSYLVGEKGKEILTMGDKPGFMTPLELGNRISGMNLTVQNTFHGVGDVTPEKITPLLDFITEMIMLRLTKLAEMT